MKKIIIAVFFMVFCGCALFAANTPREAAAFIKDNYGDAFVNVKTEAVIAMTLMVYGEMHKDEISDKFITISATIVSPDGTAVAALSTADVNRIYTSQVNMLSETSQGVDMQIIDVNVSLQKMVYVLNDGSEIPVEVVYRDEAKDIAVLKPVGNPNRTFTHIDIADAIVPEILDPIIFPVQSIAELGYPLVMVESKIIGKTNTPYPMYITDFNGLTLLNGVTCFSLDGKFIGMLTDFNLNIEKDGGFFVYPAAGGNVLVLTTAADIYEAVKNVN